MFQKEDIDAEMKEYKKKMEEQKRLRERILKEKENRRKLAALKKHGNQVLTNSVKTGKILSLLNLTVDEIMYASFDS